MTLDALAIMALVLAAIPCGLFLLNLFVYRPPPHNNERAKKRHQARVAIRNSFHAVPADPELNMVEPVSVLIPARNEESNLRVTLDAVLASRGGHFEVIVLDDHSTDRTAEIVSGLARHDPRIRLESGPRLPTGWCGKQHACHILAQRSRHPLLLFIDADVRLAPDALARLSALMSRSQAALVSGVPRQELGTFSERFLLPLIHFVLLGCLPMHVMRWTLLPGFSAGCGQLFLARREAYFHAGGHAGIRGTLHDGVKLPRLFRRAGFKTDLVDVTGLATCRMYHTNAETWRGLGKNAAEGLAAPNTILPITALLFGGQVLPFVLLALAFALPGTPLVVSSIAAALACLPRFLALRRFHQPLGSALFHPLGVLALLAIQWHALARHLAGKPAEWKGRSYASSTTIKPAQSV